MNGKNINPEKLLVLDEWSAVLGKSLFETAVVSERIANPRSHISTELDRRDSSPCTDYFVPPVDTSVEISDGSQE